MSKTAEGQITMEDILGKARTTEPNIKEMTKDLAGRYNWYTLLSAFHKAIRKHEFNDGLYYGLLLSKGGSKWYPVKYMLQVASEEAHSPELKKMMSDGMENYRDMTDLEFAIRVAQFCKDTNIRKYAVDISDQVYWKQNIYWEPAIKEKKKGVRRWEPKEELVLKWRKKIEEHDINTKINHKSYTLEEMFALVDEFSQEKNLNKLIYMRVMLEKKGPDVAPLLLELSREYGNERSTSMMEKLVRTHSRKNFWFFDFQIVFLMICGYSDEIPIIDEDVSSMEVEKNLEDVYADIKNGKKREPKLYVYDSHTRKGKTIWYKKRGQIRAGKPQPEDLDMRFSGVWFGDYFRREAYKQYGKVDVPFEDVKLDDNILYDVKFNDYYNPSDKKYQKKK